MKLRIIAVGIVLALAACTKDPISKSTTDNSEITVDKLFTHDGVTVYRFMDSGNYVYFTKPAGPGYQTSREMDCGKNCTRPQIVSSSSDR